MPASPGWTRARRSFSTRSADRRGFAHTRETLRTTQAVRASANGSTPAAPARRSSRPATVIVQRESARSSTSRIGAEPASASRRGARLRRRSGPTPRPAGTRCCRPGRRWGRRAPRGHLAQVGQPSQPGEPLGKAGYQAGTATRRQRDHGTGPLRPVPRGQHAGAGLDQLVVGRDVRHRPPCTGTSNAASGSSSMPGASWSRVTTTAYATSKPSSVRRRWPQPRLVSRATARPVRS